MRKLVACIALLVAALLGGDALAQVHFTPKLVPVKPWKPVFTTRHMTRFDPAVNGFRFINSFKMVTGAFDITTNGLCGGMVYAALDYYNAHRDTPAQSYTPVNGTALQSYIYARHMNSLGNTLPKWIELHNNPFGARNQEFFNWGLQGTNGGRLQELQEQINAGNPIPLGLKSLSADPSNDHVVLAVGYDLGAYKGDLGAHEEDVKIFVYDPDQGNKTVTLYPVPSQQEYCIDYDNGPHCWRAYFVQNNGAYGPVAPPEVSNAPHELVLSILTGGDDLRGGDDNLSVTVHLRSGADINASNINLGQRWIDHTWQQVGISLPDSVNSGADISSVRFGVHFTGGSGGDNWDMDRLVMDVNVNGASVSHCDRNPDAKPLNRFTGERRLYQVPFC